VKVGLVGTGYAAKVRAEAFQADPRSHLIAVAGHSADKTAEFAQSYGAEVETTYEDLIQRADIDLVVIATINRDHAAIARAALSTGKHVVVEYPLALAVSEAKELLALAQTQQKLLHVEHIELLSSIHLAIRSALPQIGTPFYVRYSDLAPKRPAPAKWTYQLDLFGFPLVGALSRLNRLIDLFGAVKTVSCQARYWSKSGAINAYDTCLCTAQLRFVSGLVADVTYGKGEALWQAERTLTIHGDQGAIALDGETGTLIQLDQTSPLDLGSRRGLFAQDTAQVLNHLLDGTPLYLTPQVSLYALTVADAARQSAETGTVITLA